MCFSVGWLSLSAGCSTTAAAALTMGIDTSAVTNIMIATSGTIALTQEASSAITAFIGSGTIIGGSVIVTNNDNTTILAIANASDSISSSMLNSISTQLQASIAQAVKSATQLGSQEMATDATANMNFTIHNTLSASAVVHQVTNLCESLTASNITTVTIGKHVKIGGNLIITNNTLITMTANAVINAAVQALAQNDDFTKVLAGIKQSSQSKSGGIAQLISSIGKIFSGPLKYVAIIVVIAIIGFALLIVVRGIVGHAGPSNAEGVTGSSEPVQCH